MADKKEWSALNNVAKELQCFAQLEDEPLFCVYGDGPSVKFLGNGDASQMAVMLASLGNAEPAIKMIFQMAAGVPIEVFEEGDSNENQTV
jgi:hypothetical protein